MVWWWWWWWWGGERIKVVRNRVYPRAAADDKISSKIAQLTSQQLAEKSIKINIFSNISHFDLPARGRKVQKSKNSNIFCKFYHFDLPPWGQKVEKLKKFNTQSKIAHFNPPARDRKVGKSKNKYSVKVIIFTTHNGSKSRKVKKIQYIQ